MAQKIILATASPYRRDVFSTLGLDFVSEAGDIDERFEGRPREPEKFVLELARRKAEAVAAKVRDRFPEGIVVGFDSIGWFDGRVLEKPRDREEAFLRLKALSGSSYQFFTGVHMISLSDQRTLSRAVQTRVFMRVLFDGEISRYLDQDPKHVTYAHGYDPARHYSSTFAKRIEGSCHNFLEGIPLEDIAEMLKEIGYRI
jgi:septum formation protein